MQKGSQHNGFLFAFIGFTRLPVRRRAPTHNQLPILSVSSKAGIVASLAAARHYNKLYRMKTLYILRHAKSSWDFDELSDHDRPLNKRGRNDAHLMGQELANRGVSANLIISSSAVRALTTATLISKELNYEAEDILVSEKIYGASKHDLLDVANNAPVEADAVMMVGHNEAISDFANMLSPEHIASLPTTGIVALEFDCESWYDINKENAKMLFYDFPKNYK